MKMPLDFSRRGWARVVLLTVMGTAFCIAVAFAFDSYSFRTGQWSWGTTPLNDLLIPLLIAPPFFWLLLSRVRQLAIAHAELMVHATTDSLTACLNRRAFTAIVEEYLARMEKPAAEDAGALLLIDVDHFKSVNDRFGHEAGDEALKLVAGAIQTSVRESDLVGRMGGEEFAVLLPAVHPVLAAQIAERVRLAVRDVLFAPVAETHRLSISIGGVALTPAASFSDLYRTADRRLYEAKTRGRDQINMAPTSGPSRFHALN